ncbi:hypothetical protein D9M70_533970 [compost metagenome]
MTGVQKRLHRLHQFVEVEAGLENLAILEVQAVFIRKHYQDIAGMRVRGAEDDCHRGCQVHQHFHL